MEKISRIIILHTRIVAIWYNNFLLPIFKGLINASTIYTAAKKAASSSRLSSHQLGSAATREPLVSRARLSSIPLYAIDRLYEQQQQHGCAEIAGDIIAREASGAVYSAERIRTYIYTHTHKRWEVYSKRTARLYHRAALGRLSRHASMLISVYSSRESVCTYLCVCVCARGLSDSPSLSLALDLSK